MGMNFYLKNSDGSRLHIGKSSGGWCFALHVFHDGEGPQSLDDWKELFELRPRSLVNEDGERVTPAQMLTTITERSWKRSPAVPYGYASHEEFYEKNHAEEGPNGLVRFRIDGTYCVGHGAGTWDLITGEFS